MDVVAKDRKVNNPDIQAVVLGVVRLRVGEPKAITIQELWRGHLPWLKSDRAVRQAFSDLIEAGHPICYKSGVGHWYAASVEEAIACKDTEYLPRIADLRRKADKLVANAVNVYGGQAGF